jgi:hypothetical protein
MLIPSKIVSPLPIGLEWSQERGAMYFVQSKNQSKNHLYIVEDLAESSLYIVSHVSWQLWLLKSITKVLRDPWVLRYCFKTNSSLPKPDKQQNCVDERGRYDLYF